MKGPGIRLDLDVRREWKCPSCGKLRRLLGSTVSMRCPCKRDGVSMQLIEGRRQTRSIADVIQRVQQASAAKEPRQKTKPQQTAQDEVDTPADSTGDVASTTPAVDEPKQTQD